MDDRIVGIVAITGIIGLVVVWIVNALTMRLDGMLASAIVSTISSIVTYIAGYKTWKKS